MIILETNDFLHNNIYINKHIGENSSVNHKTIKHYPLNVYLYITKFIF